MAHQFSQLMFTEAIQKLQEKYGSRRQYERMAQSGPSNDALGPDEVEFIGERDSFYIASEGENGWPYLQHRGGPKGFLKVLGQEVEVPQIVLRERAQRFPSLRMSFEPLRFHRSRQLATCDTQGRSVNSWRLLRKSFLCRYLGQ